MKTLLATLALATAAAVPAHAMTSNEAAQVKIERFAPGVDVSQFSNTQIAALLSVINGNDGRGETTSKVQSLVRAYQ